MTSTPMFAYHGWDYRSPKEKIDYSYTVFNENNTYICGDSSEFSSETAIQPTLPGNGSYTFSVNARDEWTNVDLTPAARTFIGDITPPTVIFNSPKQSQPIKSKFPVIGSAFDNSPITGLLAKLKLILHNKIERRILLGGVIIVK